MIHGATRSRSLNGNGKADLVDIPQEANPKQPMRITYFRCLGEPSPDEPAPCPSDIVKGNMNVPEDCDPSSTVNACNEDARTNCDCLADCTVTGCCVNGRDIQGFINTYYDPVNASRQCYCTADIDCDGYVTENDRKLFIEILLGLRLPTACGSGIGSEVCEVLPGLGEGGEGGSAMMSGSGEGEGSGSGTGSGASGDSEMQARYALLAAWEETHQEPGGGMFATEHMLWSARRMAYMAEISLITPDLANGINGFTAWSAANQRSGHAELSDPEYEALVVQQFEAFVVSHSRGAP